METEKNERFHAGVELPRYAVRLLPFALRGLDEAIGFVADTSGKEGADADNYAADFRAGFFADVGTLATLPLRFPVAPEADRLKPPTVRVKVYRQSPSAPAWRILYRVYEADPPQTSLTGGGDAARVEVVALLHGSQKPMTRGEGRDIDAANRTNR